MKKPWAGVTIVAAARKRIPGGGMAGGPVRPAIASVFSLALLAGPFLLAGDAGAVEIDSMEYASDAAAQAAYVTNAPASDDSAGTVALLHFDGADGATATTDSAAGKAVSFAGNAQVDTAQRQFGPSSLLLDGNGDYLTLADSADWAFGTGDFTIDCRIRWANDPAGVDVIAEQWQSNTQRWAWYYNNGSANFVFVVDNGGTTIYNLFALTAAPAKNTWYHLALVRSGNDFKCFLNGAQVGNTATDADAIPDFAGTLYVGSDFYGGFASNFFDGWIDEFRVAKGAAKWTANFTPPANPYERVPLLLHFDGADGATSTTDSATGKAVAFAGNAQLDTAQREFGPSSLLLDGNGDYLTLADSPDWAFGTGDFTIDFWARWHTVATGMILMQRQDASNYWCIYWNPNALVFLCYSGGAFNVNFNKFLGPTQDVWYHIALVRTGTAWKFFVNGTQTGGDTTDADTVPDIAGPLYIGCDNTTGTPVTFFDGWLDELRIVKGTATWTSNFTPPVKQYAVLQAYSEGTIKTVGSYSLAGTSSKTAGAKALTRTVSPAINLTDNNLVKFDLRASRTGSNIKIGLRDGGGTTTEITPAIVAADAFQTVEWDLSAVSNADKDAVDRIIVTVANADEDNAFYLDHMYSVPNEPPTAFSLASPPDLTFTNGNRPVFTWGPSTDPEAQPITYTLKLSATPGFTEPVYRTVAGLGAASYTPAGGQEIADGGYYWKVIASDGVMQTESTDLRQLTVDTHTPDSPVLTKITSDPGTGRIVEIRGTGENGTTLAVYDQGDNPIPGSAVWDGSGNFTFTPTTPLNTGSSVYVRSEDTASNSSRSNTGVILFDYLENVFQDIAAFHGAGPGASMRLEKSASYEFRAAVNDIGPATVRAWLRKNGEYIGTAPKITLTGLGIDGTGAATASMTGGADAWEQVTVTGTPDARGILTLRVETFSTAAGAEAWVDDITVAQ